jgi:hypothetical protein
MARGRARPLSPFERDFADLHGAPPRRQRVTVVIIDHGALGDRRGGHIGLRLTLGALGLFWSIVLTGAVIAMLVIGWAFISALLGL